MKSLHHFLAFSFLLSHSLLITSAHHLTHNYYDKTCPRFHQIIQETTTNKQIYSPTTAAASLRLFFHDCLIQGCDASILISSTPFSKAERDADINLSLPGDAFDLVVRAKTALELSCPGIVSCADILAVATRNLVSMMGGPYYNVLLGRRDGLVSQASRVGDNLPKAAMSVSKLIKLFAAVGFNTQEMVALTGAHTIGFSHCKEFSSDIYHYSKSEQSDPSINPRLAAGLRNACANFTKNPTLAVFNDIMSPNQFDNMYYKNLPRGLGILKSDRALVSDPRTRPFVELYAKDDAESSGAVQSPTTNSLSAMVAAGPKSKKKGSGARLWMRMDKLGQSEVLECDKSMIVKRVGVPTRDLRVLLGPVFSHSSNILAREKAIIVNLEFIKAIVTAEEILLLDPLRKEVVPFVDQLRLQFSQRSPRRIDGAGQLAIHDTEHLTQPGQWLTVSEAVEGFQAELPFEFQILEIALELVCTSLETSVADLEGVAYPVLDELARNVSTKNLERVRSLKSNLTRLLARVQKVRDEIEHLLDDNEDMAHLYLTRKLVQLQQSEALIGSMASNNITAAASNLRRLSSVRSGSIVTSNYSNDNDVEDLEMLLEAYFMQLDGTRNKILSVREYIDDTEDYVNIQLDNQRNELIQLQLTLTIASFAIAVETLVAGMFGMNIDCQLYHIHGIFEAFVGVLTVVCVMIFFVVLGYARWKKLLGS